MSGVLPPLSLREEANKDLYAVEAAYVASREEEFANVPWTPEAKATLLRSQFQIGRLQYAQRFPRLVRLVFCEETAIVGWAHLARNPGAIRLVDIALVPRWRSRGAGSHFLAALITLAERDHVSVALNVLRGNPAAELYRRFGFEDLSVNGPYVEMGLQRVTKVKTDPVPFWAGSLFCEMQQAHAICLFRRCSGKVTEVQFRSEGTMDQNELNKVQTASTNDTTAKMAWSTPVLTKLQVEDAESGANISENGATGS